MPENKLVKAIARGLLARSKGFTKGERQMYGFHWREGMYFRRSVDGSVEITQTQGGGHSEEIQWQRTIPASEWASIVASVSATGETGETYRAALAFHERDIGRPVPPHGSGP